MTIDERSYYEPGTRKGVHESTTANLVAVPSIPDLAEEIQEVRFSTLCSSPIPPPSSATVPSSAHQSGFQSNTSESKSDAIHDASTSLSPSRQVGTEDLNPPYDVYAKPYVPSGLRAINEDAPGVVLNTETKHKIAFGAYITRFAGRDFLAHQRNLNYDWHGDAESQARKLTEHCYVQYFARLLRQECAAKEEQNEHYALYGVSLQVVPMPDLTRLWALVVPGLREDSPLIEMGDTLQIRQLWVDWLGHPIRMPIPMVGELGQHAVYHSWTGKQYNASVCSVSRIHETVYLQVDGLEHLTPYYQPAVLPMVVNAVFPLKQRVLQADLNSFAESSFRAEPHPTHPGSESMPRSDWIRRMLFPSEHDGRLQTKLRNVPHRALFDHAINYEQAHAVNSVCAADYGVLPYLISGPPGTGKTKTLVEVAMQLLNTSDVAHMLICAPSEAAADTLTMRLKQYLNPKQLLRLNGPNRADNEVPRELLQYCYIQDDMFYLPPFKTLLAFSVVVTSCRDAAIFAEARLTNADLWSMERDMVTALHPEDEPPTPVLHWGALLLDEAAQATEIDILPAISVVCPPSAYPHNHIQPGLVMAGDEHQLGPRTASHDAAFSTSLFARLFARPVYANHPLSRSNVKPSSSPPVLKRSMLPILYPPFTNLIRNYRSHPAILSVPSSLFYHDTLIPEAPLVATPLQSSPLWHGRRWPVLYMPHNGPDEIERDNGGWYNISEASRACSLAQTLIFSCGVKQEDVCIMSPFAAQVKLLRSMTRSDKYAGGIGLWDVNIGPVEAYQGLEKRIVILCTTRTRMRFVADDVQRGMGLVRQERKMNVALTRAKEALVVIGSPEVLRADEHWRAWMAFCARNGLVDDRMGMWKDRARFTDGNIGVLERALVAKEDGLRERQWPALGAAAADYDVEGDEYEAWTESLRRALDEEDEEARGEENEDDGADEASTAAVDNSKRVDA